MASFRIHEDQENRAPVLRQKQNNVMAAPPKRSVLGLIDNNNLHNKLINNDKKKVLLKEKKLIKNVTKTTANKSSIIPPVVPVAQFEAFKVYEDEEELRAKLKIQLESDDEDNIKETNSECESKENVVPTPNSPSPMSIEKSFTEAQLAQEIIRKGSSKNIFFEVEEYRDDIYAYLREQELRHRPKPGYIAKQPDLTDNMRAILVDWLVEVSEEYRLHTETLYLAVNFIDRFLSYMSVVRGKLQLVGTAAMFLAAKYEEIFPPDVNEFVYITDDTYNKHQVIRMEHLILKVLSFDLSVPTPLTFINAMCISANLTEKTLYLAMYLSELTMLEVEQYLSVLPSVLAASSIALARFSLDEEPWNEKLCKATGYKLSQLYELIRFQYRMFLKAPTNPQCAIPEKYKSGKYLHVSNIEAKSELFELEL